ncbi:MAG: 4'-phosphopantetheinyl transferase family protein [Bacillus sp. (in: firmicutes)]
MNKKMEVYACRLPDYRDESMLYRAFPLIPINRRERLRRFRQLDDAFRSLVADLLIRFVYRKWTGSKLSFLEYKINRYGKPFILGEKGFHFNTSHSGAWIVCAVYFKEVGIDIERVQILPQGLGNELFTRKEKQIAENANSVNYFYDIWTAKESFVKAIGTGLFTPLQSMQIEMGKSGACAVIDMKTASPVEEVKIHHYNLDDGYKLAVCVLDKDCIFNYTVQKIDYKELVE